MKKNGILTFCFAFIPGAGEMYQGYMKRGLSLVMICAAAIALGSLFYPLVGFAFAVCCVVWMYSFFDTFNLRGQLLAGTAPEDDYLFHLGHDVSLERLLKTRHKLFGWVLVAVGLYTLYDELIMGFLRELYWNSENNWIIRVIYNIMDEVPTVLICLALIALGAWLVRGPQQKKQDPAGDPFEPFEQLPGQLDEYAAYSEKEDENHDGSAQ